MRESEKPKRRWARFSLATLLFVSLCIAGLVGGYQSGFRRGYSGGSAQRLDETQAVQTYDTTFLIWPDLPDSERALGVKELIDLIKTTIATDIWDDQLGNEIREFPENHSLVIIAPGSIHRQIRDLFAQFERLQNQGMAEQILPALQAQAAQGKSRDWDIDVKAPKNSPMGAIWLEKYYEETVHGISQHWGAPRFQGKCTEANFPQWSLDQRIATWRRGNGLSYLALRYKEDGQAHIVAGWRENS
jgi:hypothetical protein